MLPSGLCGVILAAGASSRMGRDKALLPWPPGSKGTLLAAAIDRLSNVCELVVIVAGSNEPGLRPIVYASGGFLVSNPEPERGQFSSLQVGLHAVLNHGRDNALVTLVDRPPASGATLKQLLDAFLSRDHGTWAIVPEYQGQHGHPTAIGRDMIEAFLRAPATATAREVQHANQIRIRYLAVNDATVTANLNTPEDYASVELSPDPNLHKWK